MTVIAHAGHWLANLAYAAPVLTLLGWLGVTRYREARAARRGAGLPADRNGDVHTEAD